MQARRGGVGLDYVDEVIDRVRVFMDDWMKFSQVISTYPAPGANKAILETQFLQLKSKLAREMPVLKERLGPDCQFGPEIVNVISGTTSLDAIYAQSDVAVKKLMTEWHRAFINVNETLGDVEDKRRRAVLGERVMLGGQVVQLRVRKPLPWREIFLYGGIAAAIVTLVAGLYIMRNFLGFWAPGEGEGIVVADTMTDEQRMRVTMDAMQKAVDAKDLDAFMSIFADDYYDGEERTKTALRAMLQAYITARGFADLQFDMSEAEPAFEGDKGLLSPVYVTAEGNRYTLYVSGKKVDGRWLITSLSGL